jgi:hypothetical protein
MLSAGSFTKLPVVGLWPKIPLKKAGIMMDPPISDPIPIGEPPALNKEAWSRRSRKLYFLNLDN